MKSRETAYAYCKVRSAIVKYPYRPGNLLYRTVLSMRGPVSHHRKYPSARTARYGIIDALRDPSTQPHNLPDPPRKA